MKIGKYLVAALMVLGMAGMVYAAPVGLTSEADATEAKWSYEDMTISAGVIVDSVDERKIDIPGGTFELNAVLARIGINLIDRVNLYLDIGQAQDMSYNAEVNATNTTVKYEYDSDIMFGAGVNALIYRWDNGLEIGGALSMRQVDLTVDKATIDGISYEKIDLDSVRDGEYTEWQAALELAYKAEYLIPYIGLKYSDVEVDGDVTDSTVQYNASGKNAGQNIGVFAGVTLVPELGDSKQIAINVEGRIIDEEAVSVGVSYRF